MDGSQGFYGQPYTAVNPPQTMDGYAQDDPMNAMVSGNMAPTGLGQPQNLHQIVNQNSEELMRRRHTFQHQYPQLAPDRNRRASMLEFTSSIDSDFADFQFDPQQTDPSLAMPNANPDMLPMQKPLDPRRIRSREHLSLTARFSQMQSDFDAPYNPVIMASTSIGVEPSAAYMPTGMDMTMDMSMDFDALGGAVTSMNMHAGPIQEPVFNASPIDQAFSIPYPRTGHDPGGGSMSPLVHNHMASIPQTMSSIPQSLHHPAQSLQGQHSISATVTMSGGGPAQAIASPGHASSRSLSVDVPSPFPANADIPQTSCPTNQAALPHTAPMQGPHQPLAKYANAYSSSGFDMLGVLMRVATRPRPEINIGPVDLSCAFVVCDIEKFDLPIVYCSEMFERLTGYTKHEILGRNCRFLQSPDGKVRPGMKRKYVDDSSVLYLKNQISKRAEAQLSLINYRKGGQPFMNLLTMIPIQFDSDDYKFYVGFQVDLVEQPNSVSGRNPDGSYAINYNRGSLPAYALPAPPDPSQALQEIGQTIPRDEVSKVLSSIGRGETDLSRRIWDKILLENADDVVHVLSLKGLFLYLSPASRKVLEYDASELVGVALSSVCHPSDIVPVTRELKDSSNGAPVNVVYRIRRKFSGYTWFEAHGGLHTEQGKGKKCIILVGRERPVYALDRSELAAEENLGESELWSKISTSGMFLHVSSTSRVMLDRMPEDLVGTSLQALMRPDSKREFSRALEVARTGEKVNFKHDLLNRRGQVLHAQTTIYPGDARPGFKPTFLLAQTRLLKLTRTALLNQKSHSSSSTSTVQTFLGSGLSSGTGTNSSSTSISPDGQPLAGHGNAVTQAGGHGLTLGNQDDALNSEDNLFDELKTTRSSSWQFELRQMERQNRILAEELQILLSRRKKRKRRKGLGQLEKDCANCHTRVTPEWRRGPSGKRDLCNSCGLRWAKQNGRVSPRKTSSVAQSEKGSKPAVPAQAPVTNNVDVKGGKSPATVNGTNQEVSSGATGPATTVPKDQEKDDRDPWRGTMPPKIEEAEEPPHPTVLPT
ncbi:hypothetical protein HRR83_004834 [Exophiala dermatitidis]|uniref:GATA transcription factor LreA n=2 Tax=Exophiala dermatitidis TaxID=5970 RepID=H6C3U1_EXODN|nr:GATA transcription factor LreA [Exophiala dermatitidis NIH/UT8656]KAJ4513998.1 hypothetical protein HRR75_004579 [Exophiala dermatitidis]EHY58306.1 GATA transcription factor LreA [Exophiala dermatitidis NIH/UT8656]KAJ4517249.1 hypothetical protein HRR74_004999 [Exophiala dermatitidis]KAJ4519572.1 hypothetical protein HRR73_003632 [Exophiala dermatitidis]KAJ4534631.1 hypothetical protein HRR76_006549 [Exophiala dermatitidis]